MLHPVQSRYVKFISSIGISFINVLLQSRLVRLTILGISMRSLQQEQLRVSSLNSGIVRIFVYEQSNVFKLTRDDGISDILHPLQLRVSKLTRDDGIVFKPVLLQLSVFKLIRLLSHISSSVKE
jgi:hypothetical protein